MNMKQNLLRYGTLRENATSLAWRNSTAYYRRAGLETVFTRYGGCDYATGEARFETEPCDQGRRTGVGGRRVDFLASGGRIRIGRAERGNTADTKLCTDPSHHPR